MQTQTPVFAFDDPIDYLNFELRSRRKQNPAFSVRSWARELGFANPSFLHQVLKRERRLKPELAARIAATLDLRGRPQQYFQMLVLGDAARGAPARSSYQKLIRELKPRRARATTHLSLEQFNLVSEWYHYAIVEMTQLKDFSPDPRWIRRRLGNAVDLRTVREAIERLVRLGFLVRDEEGALRRADIGNYVIDPQVSTLALREQHRQWLEKARAALDSQSVEERDYFATTLCFRRENLPKVREILREAHRKVLELESTTGGEDIYQLCTPFFRLTRSVPQEKKP